MIELNAHGAAFVISVHQPADVEGWCKVRVEVRTNGFVGETIAWLEKESLERFGDDLGWMIQNLGKECTAHLCSVEPDLDIQIKMNRLGQIIGTFALESERREGVPTVLSGSFDMDQTFLPHLKTQVLNLLKVL
jgi:hypothetical protein